MVQMAGIRRDRRRGRQGSVVPVAADVGLLILVRDRDLVLAVEPAAEVNQLAAVGAERVRLGPVRLLVGNGSLADGAFHGACGRTGLTCRPSSLTIPSPQQAWSPPWIQPWPGRPWRCSSPRRRQASI